MPRACSGIPLAEASPAAAPSREATSKAERNTLRSAAPEPRTAERPRLLSADTPYPALLVDECTAGPRHLFHNLRGLDNSEASSQTAGWLKLSPNDLSVEAKLHCKSFKYTFILDRIRAAR